MKAFLIALGFCLTLTALIAALTAFSKPPVNPLVGTWRSAAWSARTVEFFADGTYQADGASGNYKFPDAAHIILVPEAGEMFSALKSIKMDGDTLTLTDTDFRRARPTTEKLHRIHE